MGSCSKIYYPRNIIYSLLLVQVIDSKLQSWKIVNIRRRWWWETWIEWWKAVGAFSELWIHHQRRLIGIADHFRALMRRRIISTAVHLICAEPCFGSRTSRSLSKIFICLALKPASFLSKPRVCYAQFFLFYAQLLLIDSS